MRARRIIAALVAVSLAAAMVVAMSLGAAQARSPRTVRRADTATPGVVRGIREPHRKGKPVDIARGYLSRNRVLFGIDAGELRLDRVKRSSGRVHVRFAQTHRGHEVFGATYSVHLERDGSEYAPEATNGAYFTGLDAPASPSLNEAQAWRNARALSRAVQIDSIASHGLKILPGGTGALTYHFTVSGSRLRRPVKLETFIDATTGSLALAYNNLHTAHGDVTVQATRSNNEVVSVTANHAMNDANRYRLYDPPRNIRTHDAQGSSNYLPRHSQSNVISTDGVFDTEGKTSGANDAHYNTTLTYDYYAALGHDLGNINPDTGQIVSTVNVGDPSSPDRKLYNAFWTSAPDYQMVYGNPGGDLHPISFALDVVAHELTHGMSEALVGGPGLVYMNQSGAMNEAYSDYIGEAVEMSQPGADTSRAGEVGEDICKTGTSSRWPCPLRDMDPQPTDPGVPPTLTDDDPDASSYHHLLIDIDQGGVHENSLPYSGTLWDIRKAFEEDAPGTGAAQFDAIVLEALDVYTHPLSTFVEGNADLILAADDLGATQEQKDTINDAFQRHGIVPNWTIPSSSDGRALMNDVAPLNFGFSPPQRSTNRFVVGDYKDKKRFWRRPLELYVGRTDCAGCRKIKVGDSGSFFTFSDENPDISGKRVVYSHLDAFGDANVRTQVAGRRKKQTVAGGSGLQWFPSIDKAGRRGQLVAWEHLGFCGRCDTDIRARFLGKKPRNVISDRGREQIMPFVSGRWVAWWDLGRNYGGQPRIGVKNVVTGRTFTFRPPTRRTFMGPPSMSDTHLYWYQDNDFFKNGTNGKGTIMRVRLGRRSRQALFSQSASMAPRYFGIGAPPVPSANKRFVSWHDERNMDLDPTDLTRQHLFGRDVMYLRLGTRRIRFVTDNRGDQAFPVIGDGRGRSVLWLDGSRARTDVRISP